MTDFLIKKLPYDLSSHAGLAFIGKYLRRVNVNALIDPKFPVRSGIANSEILKSYLALLCLGKSDFDAIEGFRDNAFFKRALGLGSVPSSPTLRQRMDAHAPSWFELAPQMNQALLASRINGQPIYFGALACGYTPVDLDTFAMDNGGTQKELVGRTCVGIDGYCPLVVYLGSLGYCLELALRPGVQHSAAESAYNFERALPMAASLVSTHHARHEQFHSEFKTDMDLERLPSGKFDTNYLICQLAAVAMNLLRLIGQNTLNDPDAPVRHAAKRRRIKTVMQELMFKAARMLHHAGRWVLGLGASDRGFAVFERHDRQLSTA